MEISFLIFYLIYFQLILDPWSGDPVILDSSLSALPTVTPPSPVTLGPILSQARRLDVDNMFAFGPKSSLADEITEIRVTHLKLLQSITLEAKLFGDKGELFESYAHYVADKDGNVDVGHDLSIGRILQWCWTHGVDMEHEAGTRAKKRNPTF